MSDLGYDLRSTIKNLEAIRDSQNPPNQDIIHQIDTLYDQALDYAAAQIDQTTAQYNDAAKAMNAAQTATLAAIGDLAQVAKTIGTVATAIKDLSMLLAMV